MYVYTCLHKSLKRLNASMCLHKMWAAVKISCDAWDSLLQIIGMSDVGFDFSIPQFLHT